MTAARKRSARPAAKSNGRAQNFDLDQAIHDLRLDYLQCRDFGHSWRPFTARWNAAERFYETQLRCSRCKTIRVRDIGQDGQQLGSHYDYSDGYLIEGMGRLTGHDRDVVRLESVLRVVVEDTADE